MKKITFLLVSLLALALVFNACSKKGADKIIGKWKQDKVEEMEKMGIVLDVTFEFTKDKIIFNTTLTHKINGKDSVITQPPASASYIIKSDDGTNVELEATHPENGEKGIFKIKFDSDKQITLTDPNSQVAKLTRI